MIDGELVKVFDWDRELGVNRRFSAPVDDEEEIGENLPTLDVTVPVSGGPHEIGITFLARNFAPGLDMNNDFERSTIETGGLPGYTWYPHVGSVRVDGPYNESGISSTPSREKIYSCHPEGPGQYRACALEIIDNLSELAFRGYNQPEDRDKLLQFFNQGLSNNDSFDEGIALVIQRILSDPKFIYRIEKEPQDLHPGDVYAITDLDLASRLSFFLWSSIPDKSLIELAKSG